MPAVSEKQRIHLQKLNALPQTEIHRFDLGHEPWNLRYGDLPRNKHRQPLIPCEGGCGKMVIVYSKTHRCSSCSYRFRTNSKRTRIWSNGYVYREGGTRPRPEHIVIAEKVLGRSIKRGECVHHINMKPDDNRNLNLLICNDVYHMWLHQQYAKKFVERSFTYVPCNF